MNPRTTHATRDLGSVMSPNPVTIDPEASLDQALAFLARYGFRHLPVVECNRLVGILSDRDLRLATGLQPSRHRQRNRHGLKLPGPERVAEVMRHPVHCLPETASVLQAGRDMLRLEIGAIPVVLGSCPVGIVTETDLVRVYFEACRDGADAHRTAADHFTEPAPTIAPEATVEEALDALDPALAHLCVLREARLVGIVSERDLRVGLAASSIRDAQAESEHRLGSPGPRVEELMATRVLSADVDTPLAHCAGRLLDWKVSALPVLQDGRLVGILTQRDILRRLVSLVGDERDR